MVKKLPVVLLFGSLMVACTGQGSGPEQTTVRGVLKYFPSDVKSAQAWHGHNFMVGGTPVIPTEEVPEEALKELVGSEVRVTGVWHGGEEWNPTEADAQLPMPVEEGGGKIVRGGGLEASSVNFVERQETQNTRQGGAP